jgi:hypothetical protein
VGLAVRSALALALAGARALVLLGALAALGCAEKPSPSRKLPVRRAVEASPFVCAGDVCTQRHVRLPDDGEWRCAERAGVVWCAGGEQAAGVVPASAARGYRCGERRGASPRERVCVDASPDYPDGGVALFRCRFEQEHGVVRSCTRAPSSAGASPNDMSGAPGPVTRGAAPNCWVDADCPVRCDRGTCVEAG